MAFVSIPLALVSWIHPGWLATEPDAEAAMQRINGYHPLGRIGRPEDVGNLVTFLAAPQSGFITGANIVIDGGLTTRLMH